MLITSSNTIFSFQISVINNINKSIVQNYDVGDTNDRSLYGLNLCDDLWEWDIITNRAEVFSFIELTDEFLQLYMFITLKCYWY